MDEQRQGQGGDLLAPACARYGWAAQHFLRGSGGRAGHRAAGRRSLLSAREGHDDIAVTAALACEMWASRCSQFFRRFLMCEKPWEWWLLWLHRDTNVPSRTSRRTEPSRIGGTDARDTAARDWIVTYPGRGPVHHGRGLAVHLSGQVSGLGQSRRRGPRRLSDGHAGLPEIRSSSSEPTATPRWSRSGPISRPSMAPRSCSRPRATPMAISSPMARPFTPKPLRQ